MAFSFTGITAVIFSIKKYKARDADSLFNSLNIRPVGNGVLGPSQLNPELVVRLQ